MLRIFAWRDARGLRAAAEPKASAWGGAALVLVSCLFLPSCGPPAIDSRSDEEFVESFAEVHDALPRDRQAEFTAAVCELVYGEEAVLSMDDADIRRPTPRAKQLLGGFTGMQILRKAHEQRTLRVQQQRKKLLESKQRDETFLATHPVSVEAESWRMVSPPKGSPRPTLTLSIMNPLPEEMHELRVLVSENEDDPRLREELWCYLDLPIAPGSTQSHEVLMDSKWIPLVEGGSVDPSALHLEITRIMGKEKSVLFERAFTAQDQEALEALNEKRVLLHAEGLTFDEE